MSTSARKLVLFIDEQGKNQGRHYLDTIHHDPTRYELVQVAPSSDSKSSSDPSPDTTNQLPVYRLQPKGLAYRKAKQAHAAQVQARRLSKVKQVRIRLSISEHDLGMMIKRIDSLCFEDKNRVRVVIEPTHTNKNNNQSVDKQEQLMQMAKRVIDKLDPKRVCLEAAPDVLESGSVGFYVKPTGVCKKAREE